MSVVIAKKTKKGFIIGCDTQVTCGQVKNQVTKIFRNKNNPDIVCGVVGCLRDLNLLSIAEDLIDALALRRDMVDTECIIGSTVKLLKEKLKAEGRLISSPQSGDYMQSAIILAYKKQCWIIENDFSVLEIEDFEAIGAPSDFALGAYEMIAADNTLTDEEKVIKIIKMCIKKTIYVNYPICITSTFERKIKKIEKE